MGAALKLATAGGVTMSDLPVLIHGDPWAAATESQRRLAELHFAVVRDALEPRSVGALTMAQNLAARIQSGQAPASVMQAVALLGHHGLSPANLKRMITKAREGGVKALLPGARGKRRTDKGWELRCQALWNHPSKRTYAGIARQLEREGFEGVNAVQVKRYLDTLPAHLGSDNAVARIGQHLYRQTRAAYQRRTLEGVRPGEIYTGDGHTIDVYLRHPNTGGLFRPELTMFLDIASGLITGWHLSESETKESTLFALARAMKAHDHVPLFLYIDRGAGYRAQMLSDAQTGWFAKFGIEVIGALPGNPKGKGWIESTFHVLRDDHDKFFADGWTYCGDDMADETNRRLHIEIKNGRRTLPTVEDYAQSLARWVAEYNDRVRGSRGDRSAAVIWAEGMAEHRNPLHLDMDATMRPAVERVVQHCEVALHKRFYRHEALQAYDGKTVRVEYDLFDHARVWVLDGAGRLVAVPELSATVGVLPASRLEEARDRRLVQQEKRLQRHMDEARARREDAITHEHQLKALEDLANGVIELTAAVVPERELIPVNQARAEKPAKAVDKPRRTEKPLRPAAPSPAPDDAEPEINILDWQ